jgi:plastocyanin
MKRRQWAWWGVLVGTVWASGCNGGGTQPPGPPADLVPSGGAGQNWYFNNPLPTPLSVTVSDVSGRPVPGVVVTWTVTSSPGSGAVNPAQSTTDANGVASTSDSVGSSTIQRVSASVSGVPSSADFTEVATTPPTSAAVSLTNSAFSPKNSVVQTGGTVTWTWNDGATLHTLNFNPTDPTPRPADTPQQASGSVAFSFTTVGTYAFFCSIHQAQGMTGKLTVVH